ncbi:hypothetical protein [Sphingorhabdus sp.]|uniref:hypothetical protein n=1 Tax=Sphingorhabdus sp. TaxID=1902408 RepID=UPI0035943102
MVEPRQSAMQRIQVGVIGLVVVLLFVSLANMVLDRVQTGPDAVAAGNAKAEIDPLAPPDEPLAELGVTPVAKDDGAEKALEEPAQSIRQVPSRAP